MGPRRHAQDAHESLSGWHYLEACPTHLPSESGFSLPAANKRENISLTVYFVDLKPTMSTWP